MSRLVVGALILASFVVAFTAAQVSGHADYDYSVPADGAVLTAAPARVDAYFSQDMFNQPGANNLNVVGPSSNDVDNNNVTVDTANRKHMFITLRSGLTSGQYTVEWNTTSDEDGETDAGTFQFTLQLPEPTAAPPAATLAPGATPAATAVAPRVTIASAGGGPSGGSDGGFALVAGLLAFGLGALSLAALSRKGRAQG